MKKIILMLAGMIMFAGCGVGAYSVSSGKANEGMLSFVSEKKTSLAVTVDNQTYDIFSVKTKGWRKDRNIKQTVKNTIILNPGQHNVKVVVDGEEILDRNVFISAQEHKIIEL